MPLIQTTSTLLAGSLKIGVIWYAAFGAIRNSVTIFNYKQVKILLACLKSHVTLQAFLTIEIVFTHTAGIQFILKEIQ